MLVYHVDENEYGHGGNDDQTHYAVDVEEAHGGTQHLAADQNSGDAGDPWPGTSNRTRFDDTTDPDAHFYGGAFSGIAVSSIGVPAPDANRTIAATLRVKPGMSGGITLAGGSSVTSSAVCAVHGAISPAPTSMRSERSLASCCDARAWARRRPCSCR
jgi:hypothetical protein